MYFARRCSLKLSKALFAEAGFNSTRRLLAQQVQLNVSREELEPKPLEDSFMFSELQTTLVCPSLLKPKPHVSNLAFGKSFTDHMFEVQWSEGGWTRPHILPLHKLSIHPAAKVFHYALEVYEGMKAYRGMDGKIRLFRPEHNMKRFLRGAQRALLPTFDPSEFLQCIRRLVSIERDWIPQAESSSLYIRPTIIGTEPSIGIGGSQEAMLFVLLSPAGSYFSSGFRPISLLADPQYIRAWPGGCGDTKLGSNYAPTVYVQKVAESLGLEQVLWLYGPDQQITEAGTMNVFFLIENSKGEKELVTPPLNGIVLPGITRQSVLELAREWNELKVTERVITMPELVDLIRQRRLLECFGTGTACIICPVQRVVYMGREYNIPTGEQQKPFYLKVLRTLSDIYYGRISHKWAVEID